MLNADPENRVEQRPCAARELPDGFYVSLGIGTPTLVANPVPDGMEVWLQQENGLPGINEVPIEEQVYAFMIMPASRW